MELKVNKVPSHLCSPSRMNAQMLRARLVGIARNSRNLKVHAVKSSQFLSGKLTTTDMSLRTSCVLFATSGAQETEKRVGLDGLDNGAQVPSSESCNGHAGGKPGFISYHHTSSRSKDQAIIASTQKARENFLLWFGGPTLFVASFVFPSFYLRRILSIVFEDSLLTDFLILFFTEVLFYCGVGVFLFMMDRLRRPVGLVSSTNKENVYTPLGHRITSVAVLALSVVVPTVTMGLVWPWTGPAASAALAPYLVGIIVQFAFEQYARRTCSPSSPAIPVIFQVYRLHQLNRATQLVTALRFTVRGAEMTAQNLAINGSLTTLLNVLQFLGIVCIWSLSSFIMRYFSSSVASSSFDEERGC